MSKFDERLWDGASILSIREGRCHFDLCCGGHHWSNQGAEHVDWSIHWWALAQQEFGRVRAEEVVASGTGFGFGLTEVGGIGVAFADHVDGVESDAGIGVSCCIVKEASAGFEGCLHSFGLG